MQFQPCYARLVKMCSVDLTLLRATCLPAGSLVQRSVERVTLNKVPLDLVCNAVEFFEHVKDLECTCISDPQQVCLAV